MPETLIFNNERFQLNNRAMKRGFEHSPYSALHVHCPVGRQLHQLLTQAQQLSHRAQTHMKDMSRIGHSLVALDNQLSTSNSSLREKETGYHADRQLPTRNLTMQNSFSEISSPERKLNSLDERNRKLLARALHTEKNPILRKQLAAIQATLDKSKVDGKPRKLLLFTRSATANHNYLASISQGDIFRAQHTAVFIPGMNNTATNMPSFDATVSNIIGETQKIDQLSHEGKGPTAGIIFFGYQPPVLDKQLIGDLVQKNPHADKKALQNLVSLTMNQAMPEGKKNLETVLHYIKECNSHTDVTIVAHSLGTVLASEGIRDIPRVDTMVDRVVFNGSPGVEWHNKEFHIGNINLHIPNPLSGGTADWKIPESHIFNQTSEEDKNLITNSHSFFEKFKEIPELLGHLRSPIPPARFLDFFGKDPDEIKGIHQMINKPVSGQEVPLAGIGALVPGHGHSEYFKPGSTDLFNVAAVVQGGKYQTEKPR